MTSSDSCPADLLRYSPGEEALPQRLQTSMSLYSNNLCGVVLLTDSRIQVEQLLLKRVSTEPLVQSVSGIEGELGSLVQRSTEYHFPLLEQQLDTVRCHRQIVFLWA